MVDQACTDNNDTVRDNRGVLVVVVLVVVGTDVGVDDVVDRDDAEYCSPSRSPYYYEMMMMMMMTMIMVFVLFAKLQLRST